MHDPSSATSGESKDLAETQRLDLWSDFSFSGDEPLSATGMPSFLDDLTSLGQSSYALDGDDSDDDGDEPSPAPAPQAANILDVLSTLGLDPFLVPPEPDPSPRTAKKARTAAQEDACPRESSAEDKRRRNTVASARFRAKKREREAALEKRSKELETKVANLERECESLRRENGWLKGLVVGVTQRKADGAGAKRKRVSVD